MENKELFENRYLTHNLSNLKSANESLREQLEMSKVNNSLIERGLQQTSRAIVDCIDQSKTLKSAIFDAKEKVSSFQSKNIAFQLETEKIAIELEKARSQELMLLQLGEEMAGKHAQLLKIKDQLVLENSQFKFDIDHLEKTIQTRRAEEAAVESETVRLEHKLQEIENNSEDLRSKNAELESEIFNLKSQIEHKEASIDSLRANLHSLSKLATEYSYLHSKCVANIEEQNRRNEADTISRLMKDNHRIDQLQEELNETLRTISQG